MQDDPFARAVERAQATEQAQAHAVRRRRQQQWSSGNRTAFRTHATVFVAVNLLLFVLWLTTWQLLDGTSYPWFIWPLLGWGIGLAAHYAAVRNHLRGPSTPAEAPVRSKADELARLADLHRAGSLNDEEFSAAKAELLQQG
ncbi:MAG: 2TM domain-containing protein [Solirubrobacteraceae bacterium]|nr:2TM domain-containing protein [Solirubrobacteraceae bacterium]